MRAKLDHSSSLVSAVPEIWLVLETCTGRQLCSLTLTSTLKKILSTASAHTILSLTRPFPALLWLYVSYTHKENHISNFRRRHKKTLASLFRIERNRADIRQFTVGLLTTEPCFAVFCSCCGQWLLRPLVPSRFYFRRIILYVDRTIRRRWLLHNLNTHLNYVKDRTEGRVATSTTVN